MRSSYYGVRRTIRHESKRERGERDGTSKNQDRLRRVAMRLAVRRVAGVRAPAERAGETSWERTAVIEDARHDEKR